MKKILSNICFQVSYSQHLFLKIHFLLRALVCKDRVDYEFPNLDIIIFKSNRNNFQNSETEICGKDNQLYV